MKEKDQVQREILDKIHESDFRGIVKSSVRSGKTRILITAVKEHSKKENPRVLVLYPNIDIKNSWLDECEKIGCPMEMVFSTFVSMEKVMDENWDYIIFDEAHLIPTENKLPIAGVIAKKHKNVIFASGTYSRNTLADLIIYTSLPLIVDYSTEDAIDDDIISNYTVYVHQYELTTTDRQIIAGKRKWWSTDIKELARLSKVIEISHGDKKMIASLSRMRFINSSGSLFEAVRRWIRNNPEKRFIMFTENESFGKKFSIPMFNSKSEDNSVLVQFQNGDINQLCLIKKGSAGVTYPNLDNILITAINSNGENLEQMLGRALLKDTIHADIHIFITNNDFQLKWLKSAFANIPESKIIWV